MVLKSIDNFHTFTNCLTMVVCSGFMIVCKKDLCVEFLIWLVPAYGQPITKFLLLLFFIVFLPLPFISPKPFPTYTDSFHHNHHTVVCVHNFLLSLSFLLNSPSPKPVPPELWVCSLSMSLSLFCLLVQFVHLIPHMSEIIWYLCFSDWLTSLSIIISRSIHDVAKGKIFFFFKSK